MSEPPVLLSERREDVLWLVLNRPTAANALDEALQDALVRGLAEAERDGSVRAVVLAGSGERVFSAGADLKEFAELGEDAMKRKRRAILRRTLLALIDFPKPVVAALHAKALGAGCFLAWLADEVLASAQAELSLPELRYDMPSPVGVAIALARSGRNAAHRLAQTGDTVSAAQAKELGLVDGVYEKGELAGAAQSRAMALAHHAGHAYAVNKRWLNAGLRTTLEQAFADAERAQRPAQSS